MVDSYTGLLIRRILITILLGSFIYSFVNPFFLIVTSGSCILILASIFFEKDVIYRTSEEPIVDTLPKSVLVQLEDETKEKLSDRSINVPEVRQSKYVLLLAQFVQSGIIPIIVFASVYYVFDGLGVLGVTTLIYGVITAHTIHTVRDSSSGFEVTEESHPNLMQTVADICEALGVNRRPTVKLSPSHGRSFVVDTAIPFYNNSTLHFTDYLHHYIDTVLEDAESRDEPNDEVVNRLIKESDQFYFSPKTEIPDMTELTPELEWILYHELAHLKVKADEYPILLYAYLSVPLFLAVFTLLMSPALVELAIMTGILAVGFELITNWDSRNTEFKVDSIATQYTSFDSAVLTLYTLTETDPFSFEDTTVFSSHPSIEDRLYNVSDLHTV